MLKWLSPYHHNSPSSIVTEDPLATIDAQSKVKEVYAVSRVNPLYVDDEYCVERDDKGTRISSEHISKSADCGNGPIKTICGDDEIKKTAEANFMMRLKSPLNTIHEGRIDTSVPMPIWPKDDTTGLNTGDCNSLRFDPSSRIHRKAQRHACLLPYSRHEFESNGTEHVQKTSVGPKVDLETKDWSDKKLQDSSNREVRTETTSSASSSGFSEITRSSASSPATTLSQIYFSVPRTKQSFINANLLTGSLIVNPGPQVHKGIYDEKTLHFFQKEGMVKKEFPGRQRGNFTLDQDQAERLIKRLKIRKQQRCICRLIISFLSLFVFILCVVVVSLLITNGKRIFGSL